MSDVTLTLAITNVYDDDELAHFETTTVPAPDDEDLDDWADEHLFPLTGTGRTDGAAGYFVKVIESTDPDLIGKDWEWFG